MVYAVLSRVDLHYLAEFFIYSLKFYQTLFMSSSSLQLSKAANLFVI
jgi:hypothetical protein